MEDRRSRSDACANALLNNHAVALFTQWLPLPDWASARIDQERLFHQVGGVLSLGGGDGCVYPGPRWLLRTHGAQTIGDQIDAKFAAEDFDEYGRFSFHNTKRILWREYAEDMGNTPSRDFGDPDPLGGTDCAHPPLDGTDGSNAATVADQYATRHNPFVYFRSVIDNQARCDAHVVPLGTLSVGTGKNGSDEFGGHLFEDLRHEESTPLFMFITPNLCNDGHDATCAGLNAEGTHVGGLQGADLWLKHWMPMILNSPAYRNGSLLVVLTRTRGKPRPSGRGRIAPPAKLS
jgi:hypothetical protein